MRRRLQFFISISMLLLLSVGMGTFITIARRQIDRRLSDQVAEDNRAIAETVAFLTAQFSKTLRADRLTATLEDLCTSIHLPNAGFVSIINSRGDLIAAPDDDRISWEFLRGLDIIPLGAAASASPGNLPRATTTIGVGRYRGSSRIDILAAAPVPGTDLTVLIHQDRAEVREESVAAAVSLGVPGAILTLLLSVVTFFVIDTVVAGYRSRLEQANAQLMDSNRRRSRLIHILCHDLKNPVGAVRTAGRLLEGVSADHRTVVDLIEASAKSALEVIENVRQSEALSSGKRVVQPIPIDLRSAVNASLSMLRTLFTQKGVAADNRVPEDLYALAEETSLSNSVLNNLLSNAVKFSSRGAVVTIGGRRARDRVLLTVEDQGIGIPDEMIPKIFEPTEHTSRPGTEGESGTGFGMPLVKQFVESYGGSIEIESRTDGSDGESSGTVVSVFLKPADPPAVPRSEPATEAGHRPDATGDTPTE